MTDVVPAPTSDTTLAGDPRDGLVAHPDPDSWQDLRVRLATHSDMTWAEADDALQGLTRGKAETYIIRVATSRPDWTPTQGGGGA